MRSLISRGEGMTTAYRWCRSREVPQAAGPEVKANLQEARTSERTQLQPLRGFHEGTCISPGSEYSLTVVLQRSSKCKRAKKYVVAHRRGAAKRHTHTPAEHIRRENRSIAPVILAKKNDGHVESCKLFPRTADRTSKLCCRPVVHQQ